MAKRGKSSDMKMLISMGKEKGYLTYDEVNDILPPEVVSPEHIDDLMVLFGEMDIELVDTDHGESGVEVVKVDHKELLDEDKALGLRESGGGHTDDPVRMYLREMGSIPLLTREGEVEIAKRIERGKLAVIKSISRTPTIARVIMQMGDALKNDERSIRELVTFVDEELTDEKIEDRRKQVLRQIEAVRK